MAVGSISFGAEEEAYAWRTGRPAPAPPALPPAIRSVVQQKINANTAVSNQQRIMQGSIYPYNVPQFYRAPLPPPPPPPTPLPRVGEDPYLRGVGDPFRAFQVPGTGVGDFMDVFKPEAQTPPVNLFNFGLPEGEVTEGMKSERQRQELAAMKSRENRETVNMKNDIIREVEQKQAKDPNLPSDERAALAALKLELLQLPTVDSQSAINPIVVMIQNLGTRAQYRIEMAEWKRSKTAGQTGLQLPLPLPTTGEEFDEQGGLGGFISQPTSKTANDFDRTPPIFGKLITRDANGREMIISATDWINAKVADTKPLPTDSPEVRRQKAAAAADLISTLAFTDKYNSFAQKRDAGYRIQLDSNGNPVAAYLLKPDEDALKNLVAEIIQDTSTLNVVGPIEDWIEAYALERRNIASNATGVYGTGQSSGGGGGGYSYDRGGGYGGYGGGGGGQITTYYPTEAEVVEPAEGVARARLGRGLTAEEKADFMAFFRGVESSILSAGGAIARIDPQAQAIAWLESKLGEEYKREQSGRYIVALMNMFRSGNWNVS